MTAAGPDKKIIIIAGPNGAGKTTFARSFLTAEARLPRFINADLIAAGLAPFAPETAALNAGRLTLPNVETAIARVAERVRQGGHDIPEPVIRQRYTAGKRNFERAYRATVDDWALYDNTGAAPALLEWGENP
jgi:predicted ABC-type ATPase